MIVVEPRGGPRRARGTGLAALDGSGWVLKPEGCAARALLQRTLHGAGIRLRVAVETYTYELQLALVRGLDFLLTIWAVRRETSPDLVPVFRALDRAMIERLSGRGRARHLDQ